MSSTEEVCLALKEVCRALIDRGLVVPEREGRDPPGRRAVEEVRRDDLSQHSQHQIRQSARDKTVSTG